MTEHVTGLSKADPLLPTDHVVRYCNPRTVQYKRITPASFELRKPETYLSVNHLEHFCLGIGSNAVAEVRKAYRQKNFSLRQSGRFARLNVGTVIDRVQAADGKSLRVLKLPEPPDDSHCGICGYGVDDMHVLQTLVMLITPSDIFPRAEP